MSDYPMLISNKLHSFRNFFLQMYINFLILSENKVVFVDLITFVSGILFLLI